MSSSDDSDYSSDDDSDDESDSDEESEEEEEVEVEEVDDVTGEILGEMRERKDAVVEKELYDEAKVLKVGIEKLVKLGTTIAQLVSQKRVRDLQVIPP